MRSRKGLAQTKHGNSSKGKGGPRRLTSKTIGYRHNSFGVEGGGWWCQVLKININFSITQLLSCSWEQNVASAASSQARGLDRGRVGTLYNIYLDSEFGVADKQPPLRHPR